MILRTTTHPITSTRRTLRVIVAAAMVAALLAVPMSTAAAHEDLRDVPDEGVHSAAIHTLDNQGVFEGTLCGEELFCPWEPLTRAHMAVWLVRVVDGGDPAAVTETRFSDVASDHPQAAFIERFAELDITYGCETNPLRYCPDDPVSRAQMASFLARAYELPAADSAGFVDVVDGSTHSDDIDALAAAEITQGCETDPLKFCPRDPVKRAEMASFLVRALKYAAPGLDTGSYAEPTVVLDNGWVVYGTDYQPPVHPDQPEPSWEQGTWEFGEPLTDRPRPSETMRAWFDWCLAHHHGTPVRCAQLLRSMTWVVDYLGADPQCVTEQYRRRIDAAAPGVTDGINNYKLSDRFGWHRCPSVIDPIQPDGRLLSAHVESVADRCRAVLPPDVELDYRVLNRVTEYPDCDSWGERLDRTTGGGTYSAKFYSARLAEEWLEHFIGMPVLYGSLLF